MKKGIRAHDVRATGLLDISKVCMERKIEYLQLVLEKSVSGFENGKFSEGYAKKIKTQLGNSKIAILGELYKSVKS